MKKLLSILVISLLLSGNAYAEIIEFSKCAYERDGYKFRTDLYEKKSYLIDLSKNKVEYVAVLTDPYFKKLVKKIDLVHFNDSKDGFESSRDRHENLGKGQIPKAELEYVIKNCKTDIVVETPGGLEAQKKDIAWIKRRLKK